MSFCNQLFCREIPLLWKGGKNSRIFDGVVKNVNLKKAYDQYFLKVILFPTKTLAVIAAEILFEKKIAAESANKLLKKIPQKVSAGICFNVFEINS